MLHAGINYHFTLSAMKKDPTGNLQFKVIEPVPVSLVDTEGVLAIAAHPYAALLWLEFETSPEGQAIIDRYAPLKSSLYAPDSAVEKVLRGKKLSVLNWDTFRMKEKWTGQVIEVTSQAGTDRFVSTGVVRIGDINTTQRTINLVIDARFFLHSVVNNVVAAQSVPVSLHLQLGY